MTSYGLGLAGIALTASVSCYYGAISTEIGLSLMKRYVGWAIGGLLLLTLVYVRSNTNLISLAADQDDFGIWSIVPAALTLVLCFWTKEVISALFVGIAAGGLVSGDFNVISAYLLPAVGTESYAQILLVYLWCLGGLIGLWTRTGGARYFARWAGDRLVKGRRTAKLFGCVIGTVFHQGGTVSTILAGSTVKPVSDEAKVSHEELSYIIDSTASPIATVIPFNVWPVYVAGLVVGTIPLFTTEADAITFFYKTILFNFYGIFAVLFTYTFALEINPFVFGKLRRAMDRVKDSGELDAPYANTMSSPELDELKVPDGYHTSNLDFAIPILTLIGVAVGGLIFLGRVPINEAFVLAVLSAMLMALMKGMGLKDVMEGFVDGVKGVTLGAIILALAVTLGKVSGSLGTADFLIRTTSDIIVPSLLPAIFMLICMLIAFAVGSSWGTYAVVFPIAMPLAYAVNPDPFYITLCFGAVLGGAVYGDQCSPISDTTILSSLATGSDHMAHVTTQMPIATVAAGIAAVLYTIVAFFVV
ncbi:MAG: Na+/H+ antiporter NhaC family protein [Pseudomonadales bacterium]|nr:Na+/H+ antiporter NhaC family protein [Pseudomonadales bacterium]